MNPHVNPTKSFLGDPIMVYRQEHKRGSMLYIVEVAMEDRSLAHELSQMRTWLDHMKFQAIGFRHVPGANICRIDFQAEQEARAFAQAFAGEVLNRTAA